MICQHQDDEVEAGVEHLHQLYRVIHHDKRVLGKLSELRFGPGAVVRMGYQGSPTTPCWDDFPIM